MKRAPKILGIHLISVFSITLIAVILRAIASATSYDRLTGYYDSRFLITLANCIAALACVISLAYLILKSATPKYLACFQHPMVYVPSGVCSVALIFFSADKLRTLADLPYGIMSRITLSNPENIITIIMTALAFASIGYFVLAHMIEERRSMLRSIFGIVLVAFLSACALDIYFFSDAPINSLCKITDQIAFCVAGLFFLFDTRISLDREIWSGYIAFGSFAAVLTAYSSIPALAVYLINGTLLSESLFDIILMFTLFIAIAARLILTAMLPEDKRCETAEAIIQLSSERSEYIDQAIHARAYALSKMEESEPEEEVDDNYTIDLDTPNTTSDESEDTL